MDASKRSKLRGEALEQWQEGVSLVFLHWRALRDAVSDEFGGPYSREKEVSFLASVLSFFSQPKGNGKEPLYIDDLEDVLYEGMDSMNLTNDREVEEVAEKLMIMYEECLEGNYHSVQRLRELSPIPHVDVVQVSKGGNDDSDDNDNLGDNVEGSMMIDTPSNNEAATNNDMEVDGWVTVSRKKSKGRKK